MKKLSYEEILTHPWMRDSQMIRRPNALMANLVGARRGLWKRLTWTEEQAKKMWFLLDARFAGNTRIRSWVLCRPQCVFLRGAQVGCGAELQVGAIGPVGGFHPWGKKRFVEEADVDSRTSQEDVVSLASGIRKGLAAKKGGSRGGQLIGTSPYSGSRLVVDVMSYRKQMAGGYLFAKDTYPFLRR
jgi:hypothetical protein